MSRLAAADALHPLRFLQGSLVDPTTGKLLIDSIVELVANAFTVAKDDPNVQLQVRVV